MAGDIMNKIKPNAFKCALGFLAVALKWLETGKCS